MLTTITHRAMATEFAVILAQSDDHLIEPAFEALELLDEIEADLTIHQPGSEISQVNAAAAERRVTVSPSTFELLKRSQWWSRRTEGAFDITAGPLVRVWGFTQRRGKKPDDQEIQQARKRVGFQHLELDESTRGVRFRQPEMEINLGAIGKGDALDRLASRLIERGLQNFLIHGGASSVLARGDQVPGNDLGWAVGIAHPTKPQRRLAGIRLCNQSLSTSGSGKQFFHHRGKRYGHVIDPRTGYPAGDLLSLTAIAETATDAEACSTAYFVAGSEAIQGEAELPAKLIGVLPAQRQDDVQVIPFAPIEWLDPPEPDQANQ